MLVETGVETKADISLFRTQEAKAQCYLGKHRSGRCRDSQVRERRRALRASVHFQTDFLSPDASSHRRAGSRAAVRRGKRPKIEAEGARDERHLDDEKVGVKIEELWNGKPVYDRSLHLPQTQIDRQFTFKRRFVFKNLNDTWHKGKKVTESIGFTVDPKSKLMLNSERGTLTILFDPLIQHAWTFCVRYHYPDHFERSI